MLSLVAFGSAMSVRVMDAALPRLAAEFDVGIRRASNAVMFFAVAYGCMQIVFGPAGDRYGKLRVICLACAGACLTSLACALAPSFRVLLVARAASGVAMASMMPLSMAWIGDSVRYEQRQPVLARFLVGQIAGMAAGQAAGGIATDLASWRVPFWMLVAWFFCMAWMLAGPARAATPPPVVGQRPGLVAQIRSVLAVPWARRVLVLVFIEGASLYGPFAFFATHLHVKHGLSLGLAGSTVVAFAVGGIGYAFGAERLVGRLGEAGLPKVGATLMALGIVALAFGPTQWPSAVFAIPGLVAAGLGFYMMHNTLQLNATQMAPHARGTAVALFASCFFIGQSSGVAIGGFAVERVGTTPFLAVGALVLVAVGWAFSALIRRRRRTLAVAPG